MTLKARITKAVFDALSADVQKEYKKGPAGDEDNYVLDVDGLEDAGELRRANDRNKLEADDARKRAKKAEDDLAELQRTSARGTGDIVALEKSWKEAADNREAAAKAQTKKVKGQLAKVLVDDLAQNIAVRISKKPTLILPHIKARLKAEIPEDDGDPITRVLDAAGKPSALTVGELEKEFIANDDFADIIIASKASGGGASGNHSGGAAKKPSEYSAAERTALFKSDPAEHNRLFPPQL